MDAFGSTEDFRDCRLCETIVTSLFACINRSSALHSVVGLIVFDPCSAGLACEFGLLERFAGF